MTSGGTIVALGDSITENRVLADGAGDSALRRFDRDVLLGATLTPYEGSSVGNRADLHSPEGEAQREAINRWIRTSGAFDGVLDFDAVWRDP